MKKYLFIFLCTSFFINREINNCPTCITKFDKNVPPFFTEEYDEYLEHYDFDETTQDSSMKERS